MYILMYCFLTSLHVHVDAFSQLLLLLLLISGRVDGYCSCVVAAVKIND